MLAWMLYLLFIAVALSAAALAAEGRARLVRGRSRWIWLTALLASVLLPAAMSSVSIRVPAFSGPEKQVAKTVTLRDIASSHLLSFDFADVSDELSKPISTNSVLKITWISLSGILLLALTGSALHLLWRKRRWKAGLIGETSVWIAPGAGPAVVGLLRPQIVVPAWLMEAPAHQQRAVIAHEQSHLDAGDPQFLTFALCLLVLMPWNLPLWWQLHRLRRAIEVDCDARVLKVGQDVRSYGETLIAVGERQSGYIGVAAGMSESRVFLEERIKIMLQDRKRWPLVATFLGGVALAIVAVAAGVAPPDTGDAASAAHRRMELTSSQLDQYAGFYEMNEHELMFITQKDGQLYAALIGGGQSAIYPETITEFFYGGKANGSGISFTIDSQGHATSLVLHDKPGNLDQAAARIDQSTADEIIASVSAKIQNQTQSPDTEGAVRRVIATTMAGNPNYSEMAPELAKSLRAHYEPLQKAYEGLGAVKSISFRGVGQSGWDIYNVVFEKGVMQYRIALADGVITNLSIQTQQ
jgi:bla regulator protein BlaR1